MVVIVATSIIACGVATQLACCLNDLATPAYCLRFLLGDRDLVRLEDDRDLVRRDWVRLGDADGRRLLRVRVVVPLGLGAPTVLVTDDDGVPTGVLGGGGGSVPTAVNSLPVPVGSGGGSVPTAVNTLPKALAELVPVALHRRVPVAVALPEPDPVALDDAVPVWLPARVVAALSDAVAVPAAVPVVVSVPVPAAVPVAVPV